LIRPVRLIGNPKKQPREKGGKKPDQDVHPLLANRTAVVGREKKLGNRGEKEG